MAALGSGLEDQAMDDLFFVYQVTIIEILFRKLINVSCFWKGISLMKQIDIGLVMHLGLDLIHVVGLGDFVILFRFEDQQRIGDLLHQFRSRLFDLLIPQFLGVVDLQAVEPGVHFGSHDAGANADRTEIIAGTDFVRSRFVVIAPGQISGRIDIRVLSLEDDFTAGIDCDRHVLVLNKTAHVGIRVFLDIVTESLRQAGDRFFIQFQAKGIHTDILYNLFGFLAKRIREGRMMV